MKHRTNIAQRRQIAHCLIEMRKAVVIVLDARNAPHPMLGLLQRAAARRVFEIHAAMLPRWINPDRDGEARVFGPVRRQLTRQLARKASA